jgi:hypothetical protein
MVPTILLQFHSRTGNGMFEAHWLAKLNLSSTRVAHADFTVYGRRTTDNGHLLTSAARKLSRGLKIPSALLSRFFHKAKLLECSSLTLPLTLDDLENGRYNSTYQHRSSNTSSYKSGDATDQTCEGWIEHANRLCTTGRSTISLTISTRWVGKDHLAVYAAISGVYPSL